MPSVRLLLSLSLVHFKLQAEKLTFGSTLIQNRSTYGTEGISITSSRRHPRSQTILPLIPPPRATEIEQNSSEHC